jgi:flavodoxin
MNVTITYDSIFGNTAKIAEAIAGSLERDHRITLATIQEAGDLDLSGTDLLIVGSPNPGFQPTPQVQDYIAGRKNFPKGTAGQSLTRASISRQSIQRRSDGVIDAGGYAADRMATALQQSGLELRGTPAAFFVTGNEGPLMAGEIERGQRMGRRLVTKVPRRNGCELGGLR